MKYLLAVVALVGLIVGASLYLNRSVTSSDNSSEVTQEQGEAAPVEDPASPVANTPGAYVDYSSTVLENTAGVRVLFFHAPWCPQCRQLDASIKGGDIPENVTIIKVDYDSNQSLRQKYGVTTQTTLVKVDEAGELVKKYVAYESPTLEAVKQNLL